MSKRNKDMGKLKRVMEKLEKQEPLGFQCREHKLVGNFEGLWECQIDPDWLLVYERDEENLTFVRTGTHSGLFR